MSSLSASGTSVGANFPPDAEALYQDACRARIELYTPDAYYSTGTL